MTDLLGPGAFGAARAVLSRPAIAPGNGPGDPDTWAQDCSSPSANDGTENRAGLFNMLLAQFRGLIRKSGVTADNTDNDMVARAVRSQHLNFVATVGGSANALTITLDPAPGNYAALVGVPLRLLPSTSNTGAASLSVNGMGAVSVLGAGGIDLRAGDLPSGVIREVVYNGGAFILQSPIASAPSNVVIYGTAGSFTFTPPPGVRLVIAELVGGGGGGGAAVGSAGNSAAGSGGGGGGWVQYPITVTPSVGLAVVVGAGGAVGTVTGTTPANGGNGGTSSFAGLLTATGGAGGVSVYDTFASTGGAGGQGFGGAARSGVSGAPSSLIGTVPLGGPGGQAQGGSVSFFGGVGAQGPGGVGPGGGGSGAAGQNGNGGSGGPGNAGYVKLTY